MTKHHEEFHRKGFYFSDVGKEYLEVQKIDFPENWEIDYGYDFKIPTLKSDNEAKEIAKAMGYTFIEGTYLCTNVN